MLEEDLEQLYDNQFIETCAPWVLPYIGDLIGYRSLHPIGPDQVTPRAEVANTIGYRRRKGTASVLEQLARDVTGWNARAVEFFQLLGDDAVHESRPPNELLCARPAGMGAARAARAAPSKRARARSTSATSTRSEGKYNIPNIGIFLWRLNACRLRGSPAARVDDQRFLFHPLGANMPLFTRPQTEKSITHLAEPINVPEPISRRVLDAALADLLRRGSEHGDRRLRPRRRQRLQSLRYRCLRHDLGAHAAEDAASRSTRCSGGLSFQDAQEEAPRVMFHYGFSAEMGGGEYERTPTFDAALGPVESVTSPGPIQPALDGRASGGVVELSDSGRFEETPSITLDAGVRMEFRAANEHRPTLIVSGPIDISGGEDAEVTLNGLLIAGGPIRIVSGAGNGLRQLRLVHCALVPGLSLGIDGAPASPGEPSLLIEQDERPLEIEIDHSIVGAIRAPANATVLIRHSIVDANDDTNVAYAALDGAGAGGTVSVVNSTIIGTVHTELLKLASNSIFFSRTADDSAPVRSERRQTGCVRFSWLPLDCARPAPLSLPARSRNRGAGGGGDQKLRQRHDQRRRAGRDPGRGCALAGAFLHVVRLRRSGLRPVAAQRAGADPRRGGRRGGDGRFSRSFSAATREQHPRAAARIPALRPRSGSFLSNLTNRENPHELRHQPATL